MNFKSLVKAINQTHEAFQQQAVKAVNVSLTLRNWLIGFYIVEFEQNGEDRARYGKRLLEKLAQSAKIKGLTSPELSRCRQFYQVYPQIFGTVSQELKNLIFKTVSINFLSKKILGTVSQEFGLLDVTSENFIINQEIISKISYSHFVELIKIDNEVKRKYYEMLIFKTGLSVRELERQVSKGFHVPTYKSRVYQLEVTNCDFKLGWCPSRRSICFYRTRRRYAVKCFEKQPSRAG